jgi:hypothetical protein
MIICVESPALPGFRRRLFITIGLVVELQPDIRYGRMLRRWLKEARQPPRRKSFYAIGFADRLAGISSRPVPEPLATQLQHDRRILRVTQGCEKMTL